MATKAEKAQWVKEAIEAMEEAKMMLIKKGGASVSKHIISDILEIEGFPSEADQIHPIEEEKLLKSIFFAHAHAVESVFNTIVRMIQDGVLEPNGVMAKKVADKMREEEAQELANMELLDDDDPDDDDDDDNNNPYSLSQEDDE